MQHQCRDQTKQQNILTCANQVSTQAVSEVMKHAISVFLQYMNLYLKKISQRSLTKKTCAPGEGTGRTTFQ